MNFLSGTLFLILLSAAVPRQNRPHRNRKCAQASAGIRVLIGSNRVLYARAVVNVLEAH